jgi:uncharacterized membrane protein YccC
VDLEQLVRIVGVIVSLIGAWIVSPQGARHRAEQIVAHMIRALQAIQLRIRRLLRRPKTHHAFGSSTAGVSATAHATRTTAPRPVIWSSADTIEEQIERLRVRINELDAILASARNEVDQHRNAFSVELAKLRAELVAELRTLRQRMDRSEAATTESDSRALPVIGFGILLSGMSNEISEYAWLAWIAVAAGCAVAVWATRRATGAIAGGTAP